MVACLNTLQVKMADSEHVARLREGAEAWNRYRAESGALPDLDEADLSGIAIPGADLRGGLMFRTNLRGTDLSRAKLGDANVVEADLSDAKLIDADLVRCKCMKSNFLSAYGVLISGVRGFTRSVLRARTCPTLASTRSQICGDPRSCRPS